MNLCVAPWKVKSKLRQQQEENRFVKNSARITREYERVRFDKEDEYVAEYKDQHSKHPKMKDYPVTRLFDSLSALKAGSRPENFGRTGRFVGSRTGKIV